MIRTEKRDGVLVLILSNPPVNAISAAVRAAIWEALDKAEHDGSVTGAVLRAEGRAFSAGGDLREVGQPDAPGTIPLGRLNDRIETLSKPVVAALHGWAIGGGVLLSLACHARVAASDARLLLPEVRLGFVPGAGGTQRLPRLSGLPAALTMAALARDMPAAQGLACGLLDAVAEDDPTPVALAVIGDIAEGRRPFRRTGALTVPPAPDLAAAVAACRTEAARAFPGREAPAAAMDLVLGAADWPFAEGLAREAAAYRRLSAGPQARALLRLFFAERALRLPEGVPGGRGTCRLLRHPGSRAAELVVEGDPPSEAVAAARAEAARDRLLLVPVRGGSVVARLRAAGAAKMTEAAHACLAKGMGTAEAIDLLAVEACGFPSYRGGPLHDSADG